MDKTLIYLLTNTKAQGVKIVGAPLRFRVKCEVHAVTVEAMCQNGRAAHLSLWQFVMLAECLAQIVDGRRSTSVSTRAATHTAT
eukprot:SAG11_NODE_5111_length_1660_cov_1.500961_2_plen_83_part_01